MQGSIGKNFERLGGALIDPGIVLPAALPLDLCGESVRARLCVFTDHNHQDVALRPDLTLPVALHEIAARKSGRSEGETVHRYCARAFRQPDVSGEPMEFLQIGFERFGAASTHGVDAETYIYVSEAAQEAGVQSGVAKFGDLGVLPAFIDALGVSPAVNAGLRRAFRQEGGVGAYLARASRPHSAFVTSLIGLDRSAVEGALRAKLEADNIKHFGNRSQAEVVTRLMEQADEATHGRVPANAQAVLEAVLAVACHPREAAQRLREIAEISELQTVHEKIDRLETTLGLIATRAADFLEAATFSPAFGRRFTYYDGFVFEIGEAGERMKRPFGAGGRYDDLLNDLSGGEVSATAIGGVVRPDRLALAREGASS